MYGSNLPPGCNSADGGLDHAMEAAIEKIGDCGLTAEEMLLRWESQPDLLAACGELLNYSDNRFPVAMAKRAEAAIDSATPPTPPEAKQPA